LDETDQRWGCEGNAREIYERLDLQGYGPLLRSLPLFFWSIAGSVSEGHRLADEARQRSDPK